MSGSRSFQAIPFKMGGNTRRANENGDSRANCTRRCNGRVCTRSINCRPVMVVVVVVVVVVVDAISLANAVSPGTDRNDRKESSFTKNCATFVLRSAHGGSRSPCRGQNIPRPTPLSPFRTSLATVNNFFFSFFSLLWKENGRRSY